MQLKEQFLPSKNATKRYCKVCFHEIKLDLNTLINKKVSICQECFEKFEILDQRVALDGVKGTILFEYNDYLRELIYKFKGCGDIELSTVFLERRLHYLNIVYKGYIVICAPSNIESDEERGFNHVKEIFKVLGLEQNDCIYKKEAFKQSDLSKRERENVKNKLGIKNVVLTGKNILLVDDLLTTGNTMKAMISLVKSKNPKRIEFLVIAKPKLLVD